MSLSCAQTLTLLTLFTFYSSGSLKEIDLTPCTTDIKLTNGCSIPWGIEFPYKEFFLPACQRHDVCYVCGTTHEVKRTQCDEAFHQNMLYLCHLKEASKNVSVTGYSSYSWQTFLKELKGAALVGAGIFRWLGLKTGSLEHCLNGVKIYHDAIRHFGIKYFNDYAIKDCKLPCAEYMVNPNHQLNTTDQLLL